MSELPPPQGLEPLDVVEALAIPPRPRTLRASVRLTIRGRSVRLRGLRRPPTGIVRWLLLLGPGLVAAAAGNDAGGLATYAAAGARYGYDLLWVLVLTTVSLAVVQEMCARLGAATGRGLLDLIRERFGLGWALFAVGVILLANGGLVVSEFVGIGAAAELLGLSKYLAVPLSTALLWTLVTFGSYSWVEHMFLAMTLGFFAYPVAAWLAHPCWAAVARGGLLPTGHADPEYLFLLVGVLGTTITPYMQLFQQSAIVERGAARRHYGPERVDAYVGAIFSNGMSLCVMIATAATLHVSGHTTLETAADVAQALRPVAGPFAETLFAIGLLGAGLLSGAVLPLATAYTVSEAFGTPKGVDLDFRRARVFFTIFTALLLLGAGAALVPQIPVMPVLVWAQVLNGMLLPITLVFLLRLVNDPRMTGDLHNTRVYNMLGWGTVVLVTVAVVVLLGSPLLTGLGR